ncbi:MAG TPA: hypothetical protein PKU88_10260 [Bacillota bacterium]|nr:hypothetical protein [Bacillota bacterium]HPL98370.1 hypothetical protein [Bacillota bacterium]HPW41143.1 hypothetical protein [Bacillota bacterium]HPX69697.1 hypothetical protein [Bacillota bacterium]HQA65552.1 hypothetical protein [Bacillota bacterium]
MPSTFRNEELVKVQGKIYPVVGGRLRLAHDENENLSIETSVVQYNEESTVVQAAVKTGKGTFNGLGNASVKRDKVLSNAILELAETRAIARALRFAGYGVEYTGFEEVGEGKSISEENQSQQAEEHKNYEGATKTQINTIFAIAKNLNISNDELRDLIQDKTGKSFSKDLSKSDASKIIRMLKERDVVENQGTKLM